MRTRGGELTLDGAAHANVCFTFRAGLARLLANLGILNNTRDRYFWRPTAASG
jgi:hypothetical protein